MVQIPLLHSSNYAVLTEKETGSAGMQPVRDRLTEGQAIAPATPCNGGRLNERAGVFFNQKA